jgi:hypothetical protein
MEGLGSQLNVMEVQESRQYSALAFASFKNFQHCFNAVMRHATLYNLPQDAPLFSK